MTVVVGFYTPTHYGIAADSGAFEDTGLKIQSAEAKCWKAGNALVGGSGSFRAIEVARKSGLADPYALRDRLAEANVGGEWAILVVHPKQIWEIDDSFSVIKVKQNYSAVGAGDAVAIGALAIAVEFVEPYRVLHHVMKVAGLHSQYVAPPFTTILKALGEQK
jgi:hypothetical protein